MAALYQPPPTDQIYRTHVPGKYYGCTVLEYFTSRFPFKTEIDWLCHIQSGKVTVNQQVATPDRILEAHDHIVNNMGPREEPPSDRNLDLIYEDRHFKVFNKGAPLAIHPCGRYFSNTMTELLKVAYPTETLRPAQRLDAMTTGVQVFARTKEAAAWLTEEFKQSRVDKEYLALVEGVPDENRFVVDQAIGKIQGSARSTSPEAMNLKPAVTEFQSLATLGQRSLIRAKPLTGRTNQVRVHLKHVSLPIINDPVYGTPAEPSEQFGLHAHRLSFNGPDGRLNLSAKPPEHYLPYLKLAGLND